MLQVLGRGILLGLITTCSFVSYAQENDTLKRKDANGWDFIQVRSYNVVKTEGYIHDGLREGVWTEYFPLLYPNIITTYLHGKKDGVAMTFTGSGQIESVENYKNDLLEGPRRVYNTHGAGLLEEAYYSEGKKHGAYTKWYPGGKKQEIGSFNYDKRSGKSIWYFENGNQAAEYNYENGQIDGDVTTYYPSGKVNAYGTYKNGVQTGSAKEYFENGNMKALGTYENGEKKDDWKNYDEKGKLTQNKK